MKILYLTSLLFLLLTLLLIKKSNKKMNIITAIVYTFCIIYFYNIFIAYTLSLLKIKNTLFMFSTVYFLTSLILIYINCKNKKTFKKQKYYLKKKELIGIIVLIIISLIIGIIKYNKFTEIDYGVTDAALHYRMSSEYANYQKLFDGKIYDPINTLNRPMFGYYVPCGLLMKVIPLERYVSYNIFNIFMLTLLIVSFYTTCLEIKEKEGHNIITVIIALMYGLAYPLSYILFGFGYSGSGILATNLILLTWKFILKEEKKYLYLLLTLFNLGLFFSYYLFVPIMFLSEGLFIIYKFMKGKITLKKLLKIGVITLLIPTIIGFLYFIYKNNIKQSVDVASNNFSIEGTSYKNLWGNFILLIPMIIYSIVLEITNKKTDLDIIFMISEVIYIIISLYFTIKGHMSTYYYYKMYFILWIISYIYVYKLVNYENYKTTFRINIAFIIFIIAISLFSVERKLMEKNYKLSSNPVGPELANIYVSNKNLFTPSEVISKNEAKLIINSSKYYNKCKLDPKTKILPFSGIFLEKLWYYAITGNVPTISYNKKTPNDVYRMPFIYDEFIKNEKVKCALLTNKYIKKIENFNENDYDILYKDKTGILIRKK